MDQLLPASVSKLWEYGGLVTLALAVIVVEGYLIHFLIKRMAAQADRYLTTIQENTAILSTIATKIDMMHYGKN